MSNNEETILSEVIAASLGGAISASILYPLEVLKTKMQAASSTSTSTSTSSDNEDDNENEVEDDDNNKTSKQDDGMISFAYNLYKTEGYNVFFRGIETSAFQSSLEKALYFFAYTILKDCYYTITNTTSLSTISNLLLGCISEWAHLPITLPVDAWTTKIQTSTDAPLKILLTMISSKDENFYKGISAYYLLCFKPALQYTVYEQIKQFVLSNRRRNHQGTNISVSLSSAESFLLGMFARTVSTVLVFPFIRAKVMLQAQKSVSSSAVSNNNNKSTTNSSTNTTTSSSTTSNSNNKSISTFDIILNEYNINGICGIYKGLGPELTRGVFSAALMLMIKERIAEIVKVLVAKNNNNNNKNKNRL